MTEDFQHSNFSHTRFIFGGFPELYKYRHFLFLPYLTTYILALVGNSLMIFVIKNSPNLHSPMYVLISTLAAVNTVAPTAIVPNMLFSFLLDWNEISLEGCLTQLFFVHLASSLESSILLAMALDRLVAICNPLRYSEIVTPSTFVKFAALTIMRSGSIMSAVVVLVNPLTFCRSNVIGHCYCDYLSFAQLACGDLTNVENLAIVVIICVVGADLSIILFSYIKILSVVLQAASGEGRWKAFHTCGSHLIVMMCFYLVGTISSLSRNLGVKITTDANTFLGTLYIVFPAAINPIIYGVYTKEIRKATVRIFKVKVSNMV